MTLAQAGLPVLLEAGGTNGDGGKDLTSKEVSYMNGKKAKAGRVVFDSSSEVWGCGLGEGDYDVRSSRSAQPFPGCVLVELSPLYRTIRLGRLAHAADACVAESGGPRSDKDDGALDRPAREAGGGARDDGKCELTGSASDLGERMVHGRHDSRVASGRAFHVSGARDVLR